MLTMLMLLKGKVKSEKGKVRNFVYKELMELTERGYYRTLPRAKRNYPEK